MHFFRVLSDVTPVNGIVESLDHQELSSEMDSIGKSDNFSVSFIIRSTVLFSHNPTKPSASAENQCNFIKFLLGVEIFVRCVHHAYALFTRSAEREKEIM